MHKTFLKENILYNIFQVNSNESCLSGVWPFIIKFFVFYFKHFVILQFLLNAFVLKTWQTQTKQDTFYLLLLLVHYVIFHVFDFRQGEAWSVLRADGVDEPSSGKENQSDHHFLQTETSVTWRASLIFWSPRQPALWWGFGRLIRWHICCLRNCLMRFLALLIFI